MSNIDIVRAWKDAEYRRSLSAEEQTFLPEHPAGSIELADEELEQVAGAGYTDIRFTDGCCLSIFIPTACDYCTGTITLTLP
jgi:mersacidin/lichenicidin family type 2 lantibiotic